jgi:hypothetical protein
MVEREKRTHVRRPEISGTEVSLKVRRNRFESKPTHLEGVSLRIEPGTEVVMSQSSIEGFLKDAVSFRDADVKVKTGTKDRTELKLRIVETVRKTEGLRGIISDKEDTKLTVTPTEETVVYNSQLLKESMSKKNYRQIVPKETVFVEFILPRSIEPDIAEEIIREGLLDFGITFSKRAKIQIKPTVSEALLSQKINTGEIALKPGARKARRGLSVKAEAVIISRKIPQAINKEQI